jgi:hypothetical protein
MQNNNDFVDLLDYKDYIVKGHQRKNISQAIQINDSHYTRGIGR